MQGVAALHDLAQNKDVTEIIAADLEIDRVKTSPLIESSGAKVRFEHVDAADPGSLDRLMGLGPDVAIDLLPVALHDAVTLSAIENGVHLVNSSYPSQEIKALSDKARNRDVAVLPEFGMDPGIDLVLLGEAVRSFDRVEEIFTYGAGFPQRDATDNALKYKVTWNFTGVLKSYHRAGRIIRDGRIVDIAANDMFSPEYIHEVEIEGVGRLEAFPNGDASTYAHLLGIKPSQLKKMGRYVLRWPGHCALWKKLADLGFLDDEPVRVEGVLVDRKRYLAKLIEPRIQYDSGERDVVVVRIEVTGSRAGKRTKAILQLIDRLDLKTGITAMGRTVGYTASIGAQMIAAGQITERGVLSPLKDIPYGRFVQELEKRNIEVRSQFSTSD
jgi:saccharopine dehydrogenase-like NADP-dependent oxidoreductase